MDAGGQRLKSTRLLCEPIPHKGGSQVTLRIILCIQSQTPHRRAVCAFLLTFFLKVIRTARVMVGTEPLHKFTPGGAYKLRAAVSTGAIRKTLEPLGMIIEEVGHSLCCSRT